MFHVIIDAVSPETQPLSSQFYSSQNWQMNLMMAVNQSQGVAQMLALELGLPQGKWLIASPIHWDATHNDSMITNDFQDTIELDCVRHAYEKFKDFLRHDKSAVYQYSPTIWLFDAASMPELNTSYLTTILHRSFLIALLDMPALWKRWVTEMQMLFSRQDNEVQTPINGIWPWGAGVYQLNTSLYQLKNDSWPAYLDKLSTWNPNQLESDAVLLVSSAQAEGIVTQVSKSAWKKHPIRFWWNNGYFDQKPKGILDKLIAWIKNEY